MPRAPLYWSVVLLAAAMAFAHALSLAWTCDDAYISFRYAQNLVDGHGLVFNLDPAEPPVEGYTNFAWNMWLAFGAAIGFAWDGLETWSIFWGCLAHAATVALLGYVGWRNSRGAAVVPIAAPAYAASYAAASLAPAGLETAMFVLLGLCMWLLSVEQRSGRRLWMLGFLAALAAMTRSDGAIFVASAGLMVLHDAWRARSLRMALAFAAPIALCMGPYLLWRHSFYGLWVPITYYAKSVGAPNLAQGLDYVVEYVKCYWMALVPSALALLLGPLRSGGASAGGQAWSGRRARVALLVFALPYVSYVVWVGGDFMFGRFLLPVTPLLLLALDFLTPPMARWRIAVAVVATLGMLFRRDPPYILDYAGNVSDNRAISVRELTPGLPLTEYARMAGHEMRRLFDGLGVRIGIAGSHANFAFRSNAPVAVECAAGLTDAHIAKLPVPVRGKPGHERPWTMYPDYLIERKLHFMLEGSYATGGVCDQWRALAFPVPGLPDVLAMPVRIVTWDRELMAELRRRQPRLMGSDFEGALDLYIAKMPQMQQAEIARDYVDFRRFYFDHNDDAARQAAFEAALK